MCLCAVAKMLGQCQCLEPVKLIPIGTIDIHELSSILLDKLEEMGDAAADLNLADNISRLYTEADVKQLLDLSEVDKIVFVPEDMDCDDFAGILYGEFCKQRAFPGGIVDSHIHRLNWFVNENLVLKFIEPQTKKISTNLESWQGWDIKFFLS